MPLNFKKLLNSFRYAWRGLARVAREEQNFQIELGVGIIMCTLMVLLDLTATERAVLTLATVLVLVLELMNSVFERIADLLKPRLSDLVEDIKDIMAASVLVAAAGAVLVGCLILWPYLAAAVLP